MGQILVLESKNKKLQSNDESIASQIETGMVLVV